VEVGANVKPSVGLGVAVSQTMKVGMGVGVPSDARSTKPQARVGVVVTVGDAVAVQLGDETDKGLRT
jgi:hypothetical protein